MEEAQRIPHKINPRNIARRILIKLTKIKYEEKILKATGKSNKSHRRELP